MGNNKIKDATDRDLQTAAQLGNVKDAGFMLGDIIVVRNFYQAVANDSAARHQEDGKGNPSAQSRADLMNYYIENW